jgi:hypothetical protein
MKSSTYLIIGVLFISVQESYSQNPDEWSGPKNKALLSNWSINLNIGFTSYYGDLSQYDMNFTNKLLFESKPAYGFKLTKQIKSVGVSGQVIYGGFKSDYKPEYTFETRIVEYSAQAGLNVASLVYPRKTLKYGMEFYVGLGQFIFNTSVDGLQDGQQIPDAYSTGVPEFVYFFGTELSVKLNDQISFTTNLSIRQAQNDNIDKYVAHDDFDYYSLLNIGITYSFGRLYKPVKDEPRQGINKQEPVWR